MTDSLEKATYVIRPFKALAEEAKRLGFVMLDNVDTKAETATVRLEPLDELARMALVSKTGDDDCDGIEATTRFGLIPNDVPGREVFGTGRHQKAPAVALQESAEMALEMARAAIASIGGH